MISKWMALAQHTKSEKSDLALLPEMPFSPYQPRLRAVYGETGTARQFKYGFFTREK